MDATELRSRQRPLKDAYRADPTTALGVDVRSAVVRATGTWDARGTLGVDRAVPVGLTSVDLRFALDTDADEATLRRLVELTERYCVIAQTLAHPPALTVGLAGDLTRP